MTSFALRPVLMKKAVLSRPVRSAKADDMLQTHEPTGVRTARMPQHVIKPILSAAILFLLAGTLTGCAQYGFDTGASPAAANSLIKSITKEFDLMVQDFDALDGEGNVELCTPVRFAVARFAVHQALEERRKSSLEQMTRFITRARRELTSAQAKLSARECVDSDGDGLPDIEEVRYGTNPNKGDTDGDGLSDGQEIRRYRTNPLKFDSDGDLLGDGEEVNYHKLSPRHPDSDQDGYSDGLEVKRGYDPRNHCSHPIDIPRLTGSWKKCKAGLVKIQTQKPGRSKTPRRQPETRKIYRQEPAKPLINEIIMRTPLNP